MGVYSGKGPEPDLAEFLEVIRRQRIPDRVHFIELFLDEEIKMAVVDRFALDEELDAADPQYINKLNMKAYGFLGYDIFPAAGIGGGIDVQFNKAADTALAGQNRGERSWADEHKGPIQTWADFEAFPWPDISAMDFSSVEWLEKNIPENVGCYELTAHILEIVTFLQGFETFCYNLFDEPGLVDAICDKVGEFYVDFTRTLADFRCMPFIWGSDDMGFRSATMVSAEFLRKNILPWHKRCAQIAHDKEKPYLLHACGNLQEILDDLIHDVKIDGHHSFEDTIKPVTQAFEEYGDKTAILGGIDVDFLCRADEQAIRKRVRETLDICMKAPGYCLGSGNTVTNYIPVENYLTMLDEGRNYRV